MVFYIDFSFQDYIDLQVLNEGSLATENAAHLGELVETLVTTEREYSYLPFKNPKPQDSYGSWKQFAFFTDPQYSIFHWNKIENRLHSVTYSPGFSSHIMS